MNNWLFKQIEKGNQIIEQLDKENQLSYHSFKSRFNDTDLHGREKKGFFELWLNTNQKDFDLDKVGENILKKRNTKVRNLKTFDKTLSFLKINAEYLEKFVAYRLSNNAKKSTILADLMALNKFMVHAKKNKWVKSNNERFSYKKCEYLKKL